jgi:Cys-tRNA(Pro)/Cys-tRNA(Cys) deacylase
VLASDRKMELATILGCEKDYPVYVDESAILFDAIAISGGGRGAQIVLKLEDYLKVSRAGRIGLYP